MGVAGQLRANRDFELGRIVSETLAVYRNLAHGIHVSEVRDD